MPKHNRNPQNIKKHSLKLVSWCMRTSITLQWNVYNNLRITFDSCPSTFYKSDWTFNRKLCQFSYSEKIPPIERLHFPLYVDDHSALQITHTSPSIYFLNFSSKGVCMSSNLNKRQPASHLKNCRRKCYWEFIS